jgi:undecaprenyl-diphosphatase
MNWFEALIISIIEGITEFLPISSTGHMILAEGILGMQSDEFVKIFIISIQFGAILSVIVLYWKRFFQTLNFYYKLFVAFLPAAVIGLTFNKYIDMLLENVIVVAIMLIIGGVFLLFIDKLFNKPSEDQSISYSSAFKIGLYQCLAMIPGTSRAAATIVGGMSQKLTRKTAAEFSFFLAVPTMFAASCLKLYESYEYITAENIKILLVGNVIAFVVAMIAIKSFINYLAKYGFRVFGYYRIVVGLLILIFIAFGFDLTIS